jgi:hypothetical protein
MNNVPLALQALGDLRRTAGRISDASTQAMFRANLDRVEHALGRAPARDPYARALDMLDLQSRLQSSSGSGQSPQQSQQSAPPPPAPAAPPPAATETIGERAAQTLEAVNFPGFVAALLGGTFQAIVDASAQQVREYAKLVSSIATTLEDFTGENVSSNQGRDRLAQLYPADLMVQLPQPGAAGQPKLLPRPDKVGTSPAWLEKYKLGGEELTEELTEGPLLESGRRHVGEERMQTLATMVLMGINRVVVNDGEVRAKVQFHATARDQVKAAIDQQAGAITQRDADTSAMQMMVSTVKANAQSESSIKADLTGEVRISFRSEVFPLERFADSAAITLINRHARWRTEEPKAANVQPTGISVAPPAAAAPAPAAPAPAPAPTTPPGGTR